MKTRLLWTTSLAALLLAGTAFATARAADAVQAPRIQEIQAPRGHDVQAPRDRGQDVQAPRDRGQDVQLPRDRGQDVQAPRGPQGQAGRGDVQTP
jgi:hypothetical protein